MQWHTLIGLSVGRTVVMAAHQNSLGGFLRHGIHTKCFSFVTLLMGHPHKLS
jgi:hypothetical protein